MYAYMYDSYIITYIIPYYSRESLTQQQLILILILSSSPAKHVWIKLSTQAAEHNCLIREEFQATMAEELTNAIFSAMTGITFPINFDYTDKTYPSQVPGGAHMTLHDVGDLSFMNEKGHESGRHAEFGFFINPGSVLHMTHDEFSLKIAEFHCTGNWGVWQGWGRTLEFTCMLAEDYLVCRNVASAEYEEGRIEMIALVHRGCKRHPSSCQDFSQDAGAGPHKAMHH